MLVLGACGLALAAGGALLLVEGGSPYYLAAGLLLLLSAFALWQRRPLAAHCFAVLLIGTLAWSVWEVGLDAWALCSRLVLFLLLGLGFLLPGMRRQLRGGGTLVFLSLVVCAVVFAVGVARLYAPVSNLPGAQGLPAAAVDGDEWRHWGRTSGGGRFSPLNQIDTGNVQQLEIAWHYRSDVPLFESFGAHSFQPTPLAANDHLYFCVDRNVLIALEQESGRESWRFDPELNLDGVFVTTCRGVSYFESAASSDDCPRRLLYGTADGRLLAVNADTGKACTGFGEQGAVDMRRHMGEIPPGSLSVTSPPAIVNGVAVIGQFVNDYLSFFDTPSGVIRGYDAMTGELRWAWDAGRPGEYGPPPEGESYTGDTPNAWSVFSADPELGLVYIPTGNSPPDYFGGHRSDASERYSSSVVALDVASGAVRWTFQTVHHDLWDYDVASQPVTLDLTTAGRTVPALVVPTKRGQLFLLDRRDGTPIDNVVERPVPQGDVPGDWTAPTQPYTEGFPSIAGATLRERDMWGLTPLDQLWCRIQFRQLRYAGEFNPPGLDRSLNYPGAAGGSNWGSVSVDLQRGLLIASSLHIAETGQLIPREGAEASGLAGDASTLIYPQERIPFIFKRKVFLSPLGVPCQQPPYGRLWAFDIGSRELLWSKRLGTAEHSGPWGLELGLPLPMGVPNSGGAITTAGGLVFIGAAQDRRLRAIDSGNGAELWSARLPAVAGSTPMTYRSRQSGRQFVVIAAGGHSGIPGPSSADIIAFALPESAAAGAGK
ncbi:membrane-bound PQQ-dependent dehydrogenase, glucose/quinate/shikimate family [Haliea sp. E17]|uniref:membrane-bound PQQ-dependent dehydrogenase, glucose/quinate/shikimate family n=1 Tax=Haliea sp. E17 TaxID=3401576 RepID=UPI003AAC7611